MGQRQLRCEGNMIHFIVGIGVMLNRMFNQWIYEKLRSAIIRLRVNFVELFKESEMKAKGSNPYNKRKDKNSKMAFAKTEKSVKPVAKDTNKTRRKMVKPTKKATI
jgi:hypothetical protein